MAMEAAMADRKGPVIFGLPATDDASAAMALSRMGNITQVHKDAALEIAIRGVVSDAWRTPSAAEQSATEPAVAQPPGTGWRDSGPLRPPPGVNLIDAMVHAFQPHGVGNPERVGPATKAKPEDDGPKAA
jgi:hypothetical protein